jgi:ABC-2 type transport system ATP-binding protein
VLRPDAGDAALLGRSVSRDPEGVKHLLAYMPQRFGLYGDLTVQENLDFYADLYRVPRAARPEILERLFHFSGLGAFRARLAGQLSGGMKQKLGLMCALVHEPDILLLDEPTFGVDPVSRRDLWLIVHERVAHGMTALVSTAYMDEAERFDRLALLHRGRIVALDSPGALQAALPHQILAVRVARAREARAVAERVPGVLRAAPFGDWLHVSVASTSEAEARVRAALAAAGFEVREARPAAASLEDVFIDRLSGPGAA